MDVLFYDRKNDRNVKASELMEISLVEVALMVDSDEYKSGLWNSTKHPAYLKEEKIATLGYKSENCPKHCNWDLYLNPEDLVYLKPIPS